MMRTIVVIGSMLILLTSCAGAAEMTPAAPPAGPTPSATRRPGLPHTPAPSLANPFTRQPVVEQARADLARRLNIGVDQVGVLSVTRAEWPIQDATCNPGEAGGADLPAIVIGQEITLSAGGQTFVYRARGNRVMLCEGKTSTNHDP